MNCMRAEWFVKEKLYEHFQAPFLLRRLVPSVLQELAGGGISRITVRRYGHGPTEH